MASPHGPEIPPRLGAAGAELWQRLTAPPAPGAVLEFTAAELVILEAACRQADDVALLESSLAEAGAVVPGSKKQPKINGALPELRLQRAALARLIKLLALDDADQSAPAASAAQSKARKAAQARWRNHERREESKHAASGS